MEATDFAICAVAVSFTIALAALIPAILRIAILPVPVFVLRMLIARGISVPILCHGELPLRQRIALAFHSGSKLSLIVAIAAIDFRRRNSRGALVAMPITG